MRVSHEPLLHVTRLKRSAGQFLMVENCSIAIPGASIHQQEIMISTYLSRSMWVVLCENGAQNNCIHEEHRHKMHDDIR